MHQTTRVIIDTVSVILLHRRDISFEANLDTGKYQADMLSLDPCNTVCIHSTISYQMNLEQKIWNI